jgi:anhydro-N-acetylmuramic acid kinase
MKKKIFTSLGIMTGTSMDGVDLSMIKSDGDSEFIVILNDYFEFDKALKEKLINLRGQIFTLKDLDKYSKNLNELERDFTMFNGQIINKILKNYNEEVDLIGFHGQTIFHDANNKISKQLGDGKLLSQITKKIVVNNFRNNDLTNNGQGAPLTPIFHQLLSKILIKNYELRYPINIINIGGITNVTQIFNDDSPNKSLRAFDIAPGNCLIDEWIRKNSNKEFDKNGDIAKSGKINNLILNQAIENFDFQSYEKSLDTKDFDISFVKGLDIEDGCATLTEFTGILIARGIEYINNLNNSLPEINLISGGGRKNNFLVESINKNLNQKKNKIQNIDEFKLDGDFIESQAFGYLSIRSYLGLPNSFPNTTRCNQPTIGGEINKNF